MRASFRHYADREVFGRVHTACHTTADLDHADYREPSGTSRNPVQHGLRSFCERLYSLLRTSLCWIGSGADCSLLAFRDPFGGRDEGKTWTVRKDG
jgi:hypothetical protein